MNENRHLHECVELTPEDGERRRLDVCCLMVMYGDGFCRLVPVSEHEAARLIEREKLDR